jgi:hypothetical protein
VGVQMATPTWVRTRALAAELLVFQGTMAVGSFAWGALAERFGNGVAICSIQRTGAYLSVQSSADQVAYRHDERYTYPPYMRSLSLTFLLAVKAHPIIASVVCIAVGSRSKLRGATLPTMLENPPLQLIAEITAIS